ncbi:MAG: alpha/beta hydrolase [Alsobacter sp.]
MPAFPELPSRRTLLAAALCAPALSACSAVGAFNAVVKSEDGARTLATDLAYGPDPRQTLDIYGPPGAGGRKPVVIFIYGGSWNSGRRQDYAFVGKALAAQGVVAVVIDYRLVPQVRFPGFVEDAARATAWVKANIAAHGGDPDRVFVMGHSAGAYNAAMVSVTPTYLRAAGLRGRAFRGFIGLAGPYDFLPLDVSATREAFGQAPDLRATQPVLVAQSSAPPSLLLHGRDDDTVYPRNSEALARVLSGKGVPATLKLYDGVGHAGILVALANGFRDKAPVLADTMAFIRSH